MSGGLNKAFKGDPMGFLANHVFSNQPHQSLVSKSSGLVVFNLILNEKTGTVDITAKPSGHDHSHPLNGFWVANVERQSETQSLAGAGGLMVTPALTGCRLVIDSHGPHVSHVDGGLN